MKNSRTAGLAVLFLLPATVASAQKPVSRAPGDTLRFIQTSNMSMEMEGGPMGTMNQSVNSRMRMVAAFGTGDTVRVWFDSASSQMTGPGGDMSPDVSSLLNKESIISLAADGTTKTIKAAKLMDDDPMGMNDLMGENQEYGFSMRLPKAPLKVGLVWADTVTKKPDASAQQKIGMHGINTMTVVGDSVIDGTAVTMIDVAGTSDLTIEMEPAPGMTVKGMMKGTATGRSYYSPSLKLVIRNGVTQVMKGTQTIEGPMSMTMNVTQTTKTEQHLVR